MQRFRDEWVFDKTMFDYTTRSGGCSCCTMQHVDRSLIGQCSDMDTAEAVAEDEENPWPEEIKYAVWADRVSLRVDQSFALKATLDLAQTVQSSAESVILISWFGF